LKSRPLVVGNWKMHGSRASAAPLLESVSKRILSTPGVDVAVCTPYVFLETAERTLRDSPLAWGAQDLSERSAGAFTGDISASMLVEYGCSFVIVGHSERRALHNEADRLVAMKAFAALGAGLTPIICVGESLSDREAGRTDEVILSQLEAITSTVDARALARCVIAYEPVWAIGTGRSATPEQAVSAHAVIRNRVSEIDADVGTALRILYGGSVKPSTARELFSQPGIDGGLIGGASLVLEDFLAIVAAAA
jgi:triosephosphate isomerase